MFSSYLMFIRFEILDPRLAYSWNIGKTLSGTTSIQSYVKSAQTLLSLPVEHLNFVPPVQPPTFQSD